MSDAFSKINILKIVTDHVSTLKDFGRSKISKSDVFIFFILPFFLSALLVYLKINLNSELANLLITVFSIFAGLLFNLQILMFDIVGKVSDVKDLPSSLVSRQSLSRRISILESVSLNISFEILLCILGVLVLAISTLSKSLAFQILFSLVVFYIVILFALTLAMVLKRVHALLTDEIEIQKRKIKNINNA